MSFNFDPNSTENEGRWRLHDPTLFKTYFRRKSTTPGVSYVMGKRTEKSDAEIQAIRFDKKRFTEEEAAKWWETNKVKYNKTWTQEDWGKHDTK